MIQASIDDNTKVATLTLREPERRNAISHEMADQIREAFGTLEADERVGAVVVTGAPRRSARAPCSVISPRRTSAPSATSTAPS